MHVLSTTSGGEDVVRGEKGRNFGVVWSVKVRVSLLNNTRYLSLTGKELVSGRGFVLSTS